MQMICALVLCLIGASYAASTHCTTNADCHPPVCHDSSVAVCLHHQCDCGSHTDAPAVGKRQTLTACKADHDCHPPVCHDAHPGVCQQGFCMCGATATATPTQQPDGGHNTNEATCSTDAECVTSCGKDHAKCHHDNLCHCHLA